MSYSPPRLDGIKTPNCIQAMDQTGPVFQWASAPASVAYPLANLAIYAPFSVSTTCTAYEGWVIAGPTAGGNFDIGIYSATGSRLTSAGATARTASAVNNTTTMTNQTLVPNTLYYMAFSADSTALYIAGTAVAGLYEAMGVLESTTSYVLPSSPTLSRTTRAYVPMFGLNLYTVAL